MSPLKARDEVDRLLGQHNEEAFRIAMAWAKRGAAWAEHCVGSMYQTGLGVEQDLGKAIEYFERALSHGSRAAWHSLGVLYEVGGPDLQPNPELAASCYARATALGYYPGQTYETGREGTEGSES
jgi:uncharacterized protein